MLFINGYLTFLWVHEFLLQGSDQTVISPALEMLKYLIRTSTTSMTSVPKPLKYLSPFYDNLKKTHKKMDNVQWKKSLADVISLLAMGTAGGEDSKSNRECLKYCLQGNVPVMRSKLEFLLIIQ